MMKPKRMALAAVVAATGLGCAQAPASLVPGPQPAKLAAPQAAPAPAGPALDVQPSESLQPAPSPGAGVARYGGAMGYQGGANMTSWPDSTLRDQIWDQLLGPTPALTGRGRWGYASRAGAGQPD